MDLIVYYEGGDEVRDWASELLDGNALTFWDLPTQNSNSSFANLPKYVADILYLDKPDIIISGTTDGVHEKPIFSIELAACTPQYQHSLQRFPRMLASATNQCPSILIMAPKKAENMAGTRVYQRSQAIDYAAVRLMDVFQVPAFVFDWPENAGYPQHHPKHIAPDCVTRNNQVENLLV